MKNQDFLFKAIEGKTVTWCSNDNQYVVLENITADIIKRLYKEIPIKDIAKALSKKIDAPEEKTIDFILELEQFFLKNKSSKNVPILTANNSINKPSSYGFVHYYSMNGIVCKVCYFATKERELIHPKFEHLITENTNEFHHEFEVFIDDNKVHLFVNQQFIDAWYHQEVHYFQGKFSMELIQKMHQKEEKDWLGVFHASAVSNGKKSILFLGDSGNGKSTSLAILQANGFTCLADDFVPVSAKNCEVYSFPAAISIKRNSLPTLLPLYPTLATATEYDLTRLNKIVRYLPPNNTDFTTHLPCRELIFIKYETDAELLCENISKVAAFQQLVPDSWLSPIKENAGIFLDWFDSLNCYQITYSDNQKMIETVQKIFEDSNL